MSSLKDLLKIQDEFTWVIAMDIFLLTTSCVFWCLTFVEMIKISIKQKSYSLPILSLSMNVTWEFLYAFWNPHPESGLYYVTFAWLVFDIAAVYACYRIAHHEFKHSPLVANNMGLVFIVTILFCLSGHAALMLSIGADQAYGYSSVSCGIVMEVGSLIQILRRNCMRGISTKFKVYRYLGNWIAILAAVHRALSWPELHGQVFSPMMGWMLIVFFFVDILNIIVFLKVRAADRAAGKKEL